jgi:hypothetical protein
MSRLPLKKPPLIIGIIYPDIFPMKEDLIKRYKLTY